MFDAKVFGDGLAVMVRDYVSHENGPLVAKLEALEKWMADGVHLQAVPAMIATAIAALPPVKDGENGKDAEPVDLIALREDIVKSIPVPKEIDVHAEIASALESLADSYVKALDA